MLSNGKCYAAICYSVDLTTSKFEEKNNTRWNLNLLDILSCMQENKKRKVFNPLTKKKAKAFSILVYFTCISAPSALISTTKTATTFALINGYSSVSARRTTPARTLEAASIDCCSLARTNCPRGYSRAHHMASGSAETPCLHRRRWFDP